MQFLTAFSLLAAVAAVYAAGEGQYKDFTLSCKDWFIEQGVYTGGTPWFGANCKGIPAVSKEEQFFRDKGMNPSADYYKGGYSLNFVVMRNCFTNDDGKLVYRKGEGNVRQCRDWKVKHKNLFGKWFQSADLSVSCQARDGSWKESTIDMSKYVGNVDGRLHC